MTATSTLLALAGSPQGGEPHPLASLVLMMVIFGIFYFVLILPMRTKQRKLEQLEGRRRQLEEEQRQLEEELAALEARRQRIRARQTLAGEVEGLIEAGRNAFAEERLETALVLWRQAQQIDPQNKRIHAYIARAERELDKLARVREQPAEAPTP